jgi:hypothetical protein
VLPFLRLLPTFSGLAIVVSLAAYTLFQTVTQDASITVAPARSSPAQLGIVASAGPYPVPMPEPLVVHLACDQEDATLARIHDPPPPGRYPFVLRLDQVPEDMRALYRGDDTVFPRDARIVTTPCLQALIDSGAFP